MFKSKNKGDAIKRIIFFITLFVFGYIILVFIQAKISENDAEKTAKKIFLDIAHSWDSEIIRAHSTNWLKTSSRLTPEEIQRLATNDLGGVKQILKGPKCKFESGFSESESKKMIWSICTITAKFDKKTATLEFRMISQNRPSFLSLAQDMKLNDFTKIDIHNQ